MIISTVSSRETAAKLRDLRALSPAVFLGSAVSIWHPTQLPTGETFAASLYETLFTASLALTTREETLLRELFDEMPFEHLLELAKAPLAVSRLLNRVYGASDDCNPVHERVAEAFYAGRISSIVTTNYDRCMDGALRTTGRLPFAKVVTEQDADAYRTALASTKGLPCYFKIHGSADPGLEASIVGTLSQAGLLPQWKRQLLSELLSNNDVVFVGYSGKDFELCPEIARIPGVRIIWNALDAAFPSPNAEALLTARGGHLLVGDMRDFLSAWLGPTSAHLTRAQGPAPAVLHQYFSAPEIAAWRVRVLNNIGVPVLALRSLDADEAVLDRVFVERERARALFNAGRYETAARLFSAAGIRTLQTPSREEGADFLLDASDAWRANGAFVRATLALAKAARAGVGQHRAKALLKGALILQNAYDALDVSGLHLLAVPIRRLTRHVLRACAAEANAHGNWYDFQQTALVAVRMNIPLPSLEAGDSYAPPDALRGYQQLGYYLARVAAFLDRCTARPRRERSTADLAETIAQIDHDVDRCSILGLTPLVWKLLAVRSGVAGPVATNTQRMLTDAFWACEYRPLMRRLQLQRYGLGRPPA